ncbi:energy transducer TonB [Aquabacterium sp.]|uniref:energy transducer TonB n=1 Tax=Aquabacterium sp. TaxID=1872578 RepID=UPI002C6D7B28|nr:energy transducer TonB [Aquabacterium sp.]HSW05522.1 energy transducer TonB [Aquabacterium sp.]
MSAILFPGGGLVPATIRLAPPASAQPVPPAGLPLSATRPGRSPQPVAAHRGTGLVVVVLIHAVIGWALASGLARQAIEVIQKPIQLAIIPEIAPPPPPPPPKVEKIRPAPKAETPPPPAYVPPPELVPPVAAAAPVIRAVQAEPPKEPVVIAPPVPVPPAPEPRPAVVKQEISLACPGYQNVLAQMLEEAMDRVGVAGTVSTRLVVRGNQVVDATIVSGPKEYAKYVQAAVKRMKCSAGGADEVQVALNINFSK